MKEKLSAFGESVKDFWSKTSRKMRILFLSVAAAILAISLVVVLLLNRSDYIILYDNLSTGENAEIIAQLQEMGVDAVLDGNKLLIPQKDENAVRMQLAYKGYTNSGFDYTTFAKGGNLTATQSDKDRYWMFEMQDRLQATIETFPEVTEAVVNISMPERGAFVVERDVTPPSASVKLKLNPGRQLSAQQIQGIVNIVKYSVPGLTEENIAIADGTGDLLGAMRSGQEAANSKLALTEEVNQVYRKRIRDLLVPVYGEENVQVAVNAVLDIDQQTTQETTYNPLDPDNPASNPVDYHERAREKTGDTGFAAQGVPGANDNVDIPEYPGQDQDMEESDYYSDHEITDYLVSSVRTEVTREGMIISDMTVAVLIDDGNTMTTEQRGQLRALIASAAGISEDNVSLQTFSFAAADGTDSQREGNATESDGVNLAKALMITGLIVLGILLIAIAVIVVLRRRRLREQQLAWELAEQEEAATLMDLLAQDEFEPIAIPETSEQKLKAQIKDLANTDPEIVAQLIKTWLMDY